MRTSRPRLLLPLCTLLVGLCAACAGASGQSSTATTAPGRRAVAPSTTASTAVAPSSSTSTTLTPEPARRVVLLGDSTMLDASPALAAMFEATGAEVTTWAGVGFGLTGLGIDSAPSHFREEWARLVREEDPDLFLVMLGFWDLDHVEEQGAGSYGAVVDESLAILTAEGATVLWMSVPPGGARDEWPQDAVYRAAADRSPGDVRFVDVEASQRGPDGDHPVSFVTADGTVRHLRKADGWHFCQDGAEQLATMMNQVAVAGGLSVPAAGWESGAWRASVQYQEAACAS